MGRLLQSTFSGIPRRGIPRAFRDLITRLIMVLWFISQPAGTAPAQVASSSGGAQDSSARLKFVREFSSAQDVKRAHPVLDRTLDVLAGTKEGDDRSSVLRNPYAISTDPQHRVLVTDVGAVAIHVFDFTHYRYSRLQGGDDRLRRPVGVAADHVGNIYVSDSSSGDILVYDAKGKFQNYLVKKNGTESYFENPSGITIDPSTELIFVCDSGRHMLIVLNKNGHVLQHFGKRGGGTKPGEFRQPTQVAVMGGEIFVLDSGNHRVQILDAQGKFRREIQLPDSDIRSGLAVDKDRNVYVSDTFNRINVFNYEGRLLYTFGQFGTKPHKFAGISGLWVDSGRCLYVADAQSVESFQIRQTGSRGCQ